MVLVLQIITVAFLVFTFLPMFKGNAWWIRIFDFPRSQVFVLLIITLILTLWFNAFTSTTGILFILLQVTALIYLSIKIFPYTVLSKKQVKNAPPGLPSFRLLIFNVQQENRNFSLTLGMIKRVNPDIILLVETGSLWSDAMSILGKDYPYSIRKPLDNTYGMLLYSKLELKNNRINFLVEEDVPSFYTIIKLTQDIEVEGWFVHPKPPKPANNTDKRDRELLLIGKNMSGKKSPLIIAGDLNDVAWSQTTRLFQRISGLLDPRIGRGFYNTFHAKIWLLRWPLDHVFHSHHFKLSNLVLEENLGSDHFPVWVELTFDPEGQEDKVPVPDKNDSNEADRKIENGNG